MATSQSFDWAQFYGPTATAADSIAVSTGPNKPDPVHNIEGRVGKSSSGRRRSRASRRAPTTLLNTDPTNFRAMVQQFTGAPAGPYQNRAGPVINFGYGSGLGQAPVQYNQHLNQGQAPPVYMEGTGSFPQGGIIGNNGFVQGFNFDANDGNSAASAASSGVFMDGMGMRGVDPANDRNGGYFL